MKKTTIFLLLVLLSTWGIFAQTTEDFDSETIGGVTFTNNGQNFTTSSQAGGPFDVYNVNNAGWNGTARDNQFIDNSDFAFPGQPIEFTISSTGQVPFYLKSIYLFLSNYNLNQPTAGSSITITAKLNGATVYTTTSATGFNSNPNVNNGYTFIDFSTFGGSNNSNTLIDQYVITSTGDIEYVALDAMRWQIDCTAATAPVVAVSQTLCNPATVANLVATGSGTIKWYDDPTGGTALSTSNVLTTKTYYVSNTVGVCESNRTAVSVTIGSGITEWTSTGWSAGIPNSFSTVIIKADYTGPGFSACSLEILPNNFVEITSNQTLNINGLVNVAASSSLVLNDNTYLLQAQNVTNIGPISLTKFSSPVIRLDYVAWSSPVADLNLASFSPNTLTNRFYNYDPAGNTTATAWIPVNPLTNNFTTARGTLIRTPNNWSSTIYDNYLGVFRGVPNNGTYTPTVTPGFNLLGNPYPSAISADAFLADNTSIGSTTLYFWAHVAPIVSGAYAQNNYATYTTAGGVAAAGGGPQPNGIIPIGQGFFTNVTTAGTAIFKNTQRTAATNGQSFRTSASAKESLKNTTEKHRFWLDLSSPNIPHNQMMVAYMQGASNNFDPADGKAYQTNSNMLYTLVDNGQYVIQAKALPFADTDMVPLGFNAANAGSFTITLSQEDGLFDSQEIYLKDSQLGILHNLKTAAYTFNSAVGTFNQRFEVIYTLRTLSNPTTIAADASLIIYKNANGITINWSNTPIAKVILYDLQGRKLRAITNNNTDTLRIENVTIVNQVVLVEVVTSAGKRSTKKLIL